MPSWSGSHIWRTMSMGHSSFSSSSMSFSSGSCFLAKSLRDFKLSFRVFAAIIVRSSLCYCVFHFANFVGQFGQELQDVVHNPDICHLEDRGFGILVDGDQERIAFNAGQMLECATDAACHVHLGLDGFSG